MNDEQQIRELMMVAAELPAEIEPPVARLLKRGRRQRARRTTLVAATAAVAVLAAGSVPAAIHALRAAPYGGPAGAWGALFGTPRGAESGLNAAELTRLRWSRLPASPLGARTQPVLAWTGRELIELAGPRRGSTAGPGAAYDPATGRWHRIAGVGRDNIQFTNAVSVWTGQQLFVTNGQQETCDTTLTGPNRSCEPQAGLYNPATNQWTDIPLPHAMYGLDLVTPVWTGRDIILAGSTVRGRLGVAAYDPATGRWQMITPALPAGHPIQNVAITATDSRLILWSMWTLVHGGAGHSGVDVLALGGRGTWRDVTGRWPQDQTVTAPFFTGTEILVAPGQVWCGDFCSPPPSSLPGYFASPRTLARTIIPPGPLGRTDPSYTWTGRAIIAEDLYDSIGAGGGHGSIQPGELALWDPATGRWSRLPAVPDHPSRAPNPVWAGTELLALTGQGQLLALRS